MAAVHSLAVAGYLWTVVHILSMTGQSRLCTACAYQPCWHAHRSPHCKLAMTLGLRQTMICKAHPNMFHWMNVLSSDKWLPILVDPCCHCLQPHICQHGNALYAQHLCSTTIYSDPKYVPGCKAMKSWGPVPWIHTLQCASLRQKTLRLARSCTSVMRKSPAFGITRASSHSPSTANFEWRKLFSWLYTKHCWQLMPYSEDCAVCDQFVK